MAVLMVVQLNILIYHFDSLVIIKLCSVKFKNGACHAGEDGEEEKQEISRGRSGPPSLTRAILSSDLFYVLEMLRGFNKSVC